MNTYVVMRRAYWNCAEDLEKSASISARVGSDEMPNEVKWIRTYVVKDGGKLGTVCIYQGVSPEAVREHARRVGMPADEVLPVENLVVINPDPALAGK